MLSDTTIDKIEHDVQAFWKGRMHADSSLLRGKEMGHKLADHIDEQTTAFLHEHYNAAFERDRKGRPKSRSMGDIWIEEAGIFHPINIKTGIVGSEGQPNMVSLNKLLRALYEKKIDSYYLLFVKVERAQSGDATMHVHMVDLLDITAYITFDAGPGQLMLKAGPFFRAIQSGRMPKSDMDLKQKIEKLFELLRDGEERLRRNRAARFARTTQKLTTYLHDADLTIQPDNQKNFRLS